MCLVFASKTVDAQKNALMAPNLAAAAMAGPQAKPVARAPAPALVFMLVLPCFLVPSCLCMPIAILCYGSSYNHVLGRYRCGGGVATAC